MMEFWITILAWTLGKLSEKKGYGKLHLNPLLCFTVVSPQMYNMMRFRFHVVN